MLKAKSEIKNDKQWPCLTIVSTLYYSNVRWLLQAVDGLEQRLPELPVLSQVDEEVDGGVDGVATQPEAANGVVGAFLHSIIDNPIVRTN